MVQASQAGKYRQLTVIMQFLFCRSIGAHGSGARDIVVIFRDVLKGIIADDLLKTEAKEAKMCVMYAQKIVALFEQPSDNELEFLKWVESTLTEMIGSYPENKVWQNFHQLQCTDHFKEQWEQYLENCNLCKEPIFYQHVTLKNSLKST